MASAWYNVGKTYIAANGTGNITIKAMLVGTGYTFSAAHAAVDTISAQESSGTGYTGGFSGAGRITLGTDSWSTDQGNNRAEFTAANLVWSGLDVGTVRAVVFIVEITNDAGSVPIAFMDLSDVASNGGDFTVSANAEGFLQLA